MSYVPRNDKYNGKKWIISRSQHKRSESISLTLWQQLSIVVTTNNSIEVKGKLTESMLWWLRLIFSSIFNTILGPFLRTIFSKLENMLQNPLHVNLLLTGIIARLAHYSQPLLRSLLLNHSLVLETNVKSLFQVYYSNLLLFLFWISFYFLIKDSFKSQI
jgi:hypothetical protein